MAYRFVVTITRWGIVTDCLGGIASFQAIMHVLSELRTPFIDAPDRQRAIRALQTSRSLRESNTAKPWQAVKNMIDKAVAEHNAGRTGQAQDSSPYTSTVPTTSGSLHLEVTSKDGLQMPLPMDSIQSYPFQQRPFSLPSQTSIPLQPPPQQQVPIESMATLQNLAAPSWDDLNLSNIANIIGDLQPTPGVVPDFDFVSLARGATRE